MIEEIEGPIGTESIPVFSFPTQKRPRAEEYVEPEFVEENDSLYHRSEPPEFDLHALLTENMDSYKDRWEAISQWEELFPSPHLRATIYSLMEADFRKCCEERVNNEDKLTVDKTVIRDIVNLYVRSLWKTNFQKEYRKRKKIASKAEGTLGEETVRQEKSEQRDKTTLALEAFIAKTELYWDEQYEQFQLSSESAYKTESCILWYSRIYLCLCEHGYQRPTVRRDVWEVEEDSLVSFQTMYPALGSVSQYGSKHISSYKQGKLLDSIESLWQNWNETPYSSGLCDYVENLFHRYAILCFSKFRGKSKTVLDRDGMYDENVSDQQSLDYVGDDASTLSRSANDKYIQYGMTKLRPMLQTVDLLRRFVWPQLTNNVEPKDSRIPHDVWHEGMLGFMRYTQKMLIDNLTTKEYIRDTFREHIYDFMLKPGEAVYFSVAHSNESFNPYNIMNRIRSSDVNRLDKLVVSQKIETMLSLYGDRIATPTDIPNTLAFKDSRNAWIALQYSCIHNYFNSGLLYKRWNDFFFEGNPDDILFFLIDRFAEHNPPKLSIPRIFRIAASFLIYLPWNCTVVKTPGYIQDFEGGMVSALFVAIWELNARMRRLKPKAERKKSNALLKEIDLLTNLTEAITTEFFMKE